MLETHTCIFILKNCRLQSDRGLPALTKTFEGVKFKGKGHEVSTVLIALKYMNFFSWPLGHGRIGCVCVLTFNYGVARWSVMKKIV